jgi:hypothetical protein
MNILFVVFVILIVILRLYHLNDWLAPFLARTFSLICAMLKGAYDEPSTSVAHYGRTTTNR